MMNLFLKKLGILFMILMISTGIASTSFAESTVAIAHLQKKLSSLSYMQATFYQRVIGSELNVVDEGDGKFYLSRPSRFRWDYFADDGQTLVNQIISDGSNIYIYDPDIETVTIRSLQKTVLQIPSLILVSDSIDLDKFFQVTEISENLGLNWFLLKPLSVEANYDELRLGFFEEELVAFSYVDALGQTTQLQFDAILNKAIAKSVFEFIVPEGTDINGEQ